MNSILFMNKIVIQWDKENAVNCGQQNQLFLRIVNCGENELIFSFDQDKSVPHIHDDTEYEDRSRLYFYFPSPYFADKESLMNIRSSVYEEWDIKKIEGEDYYSVYQALIPIGQVKLASGETFIIQLDGICPSNVKTSPSMSMLMLRMCGVYEVDNNDKEKRKLLPNADGFLPLYRHMQTGRITSFSAERHVAGFLDKVKLSWNGDGTADKIIFSPCLDNSEELSLNGSKIVTQYDENVNYSLKVVNGEEETYHRCNVSSQTGRIVELPKEVKINYGDTAKIDFTLRNVYHGYVDNGIGRIDCDIGSSAGRLESKGSFNVSPRKNKITEYTLSCWESPYSCTHKTVSVIIEDFIEAKFTYYYSYYAYGYRYYYFKWEVVNMKKAYFQRSDSVKFESNKPIGIELIIVYYEPPEIDVLIYGPGGQEYRETVTCTHFY